MKFAARKRTERKLDNMILVIVKGLCSPFTLSAV